MCVRVEQGEEYVTNTTNWLTVLKTFIWKQKDNISSHMIENKEVKGKKRSISTPSIPHSKELIHKSKKSGQGKNVLCQNNH